MNATAASLTPVEPSSRRNGFRGLVAGLALTLLSLVAVLVGFAAPASAATVTPAAASTANVGPALGWSQDTVYVQSDATSRWPVKTAAQRLAKGSPLDLVVVATCPVRTSSSQPAVQCIHVSSGDLGGGTLAGTTHWTFDKTTNKLTSATVTYNDRWAKTASYADRLNIAEHELGHAVGLAHVNRTSSIMNPVAHGRTKPDAGDLKLLNKLY